MSDVMATVGVSKNASEGMGKAVDALFGVSNGVVGVLNSLGMTNLASSVKASAGRAHEARRRVGRRSIKLVCLQISWCSQTAFFRILFRLLGNHLPLY